MIALQRMASRCLNRLIGKGRTRMDANPNLDKMIISAEWRKLNSASTQREKENAAIDILFAVLSYLAKIKCEDIEEKIWERIKEKL